MTDRSTGQHPGFTLVELLVVIGIIGVLAAIIFPIFLKARAKGWETTCLSNQAQLAKSILMYVQDHNDTLPGTNFWTAAQIDAKITHCPADRQAANYVYNTRVASQPLDVLVIPQRTLLVADGHSDDQLAHTNADLDFRHTDATLIAAFADGHAARCRQRDTDIRFPGDQLRSPDEVKTYLGIELIPIYAPPNDITCHSDTALALPIILRELSLYTADMLSQHPNSPTPGPVIIDRILLVPKDLHTIPRSKYPPDIDLVHPYDNGFLRWELLNNEPVQFFKGQNSGVTMIIHHDLGNSMYLDFRNRYNNAFRISLHRNLFLTLLEFGSLAIDDSAWMQCNPSGFAYKPNGLPPDWNGHYDPSSPFRYEPYSSIHNILNLEAYGYPTTDQASLYYFSMVDPVYVEARGEYDAVLKTKTALLRKYLQQYSPKMDDEYWKFIAKVTKPMEADLPRRNTHFIPPEE